MSDQDALTEIPQPQLSRKEKWDITFLVLAFSCVTASNFIVIGSGAVVILSVGGSNSLAPFSVAVVRIGTSIVSLTTTSWLFARWGRKIGFWVGSALGALGVTIACVGVIQSSTAIVLLGQALSGAGLGIGMYIRFAVVEVVPTEFASRAVGWVLAGGCLAAFLGPETSQATKGALGDDNRTFLGTFIVAGGFFVLQAIFIALVGFPPPKKPENGTSKTHDKDEEAADDPESNHPAPTAKDELWTILRGSAFLLPLGAAVASWVIMAMPMSIFRVTMGELGYSDRQSLTVMELHFISMYAPGFWSGAFIRKHGPIRACKVAVACFIAAIGVDLCAQENNNTTAAWYVSLILLGIGWNFGFSSATVWSTQSYKHAMHLKPKVQAANEGGMFLLSGAAIFSTGYLYEDAGGGEIDGWRLLHYPLIGVVAGFGGIVAYASLQEEKVAGPESAAPSEVDDVQDEIVTTSPRRVASQ